MPKARNVLSDKYLEAIGSVVTNWSRLEWQMCNLLVVGLDIPKDAGRVLTVGMEIGVICGCLRTMTHSNHWVKDETLRKGIKKLTRDVLDTAKSRGEYAHSIFTNQLDREGPSRLLFKEAAHRIQPSKVAVPVDDISAFSDELWDLQSKATDLTVRLVASRRKSE
jgi:hypothetical protein